MNLEIFAELLECAYDVQVLSTQFNSEDSKIVINEKGNAFTFMPCEQSVYCLTNNGYFELHVTYFRHAFNGEPCMNFSYYLDTSLTVVPLETVRELVEIQFGTEGFLCGCKDEHISIKAN